MTETEVLEITRQREEEEEERKLLSARELGQAVKKRLKELRWVQQDLAEELNTSQSVISSIIAGSYLLTFDLVTRLARSLKLSPIKLASYYWKDEEQELTEQHHEAIERIREFLTEYYQIGGHQQDKEILPPLSTNQHPANKQTDIGIEKAKVISKNRNPRKKQPAPKTNLENNK